MIYLHQPPGAWGLPSTSPFCVKLETWLRMAGIEYEVRNADLGKAPKGKVPYIADGEGLLGDSELIIGYLKGRYGVSIDNGMTREELAQSVLLRRTLEDSTYWMMVHLRWVDPEGWAAFEPVFRKMLPPIIGGLLVGMIRKRVREKTVAQGVGRHSDAERLEMVRDDIGAVTTVLGDRPFLLGELPRSIDATAYGILESLRAFPVDSPTRRLVTEEPRLLAYLERIKGRWYGSLQLA